MTQEIKTEKFEGLLVKVPEDAYGFKINKWGNGLLYADDESEAPFPPLITLPDGKWKLIGNPFELSEEEVLKIIPRMKDSGYPFDIEDWDESWINTLDMLKIYSNNPYGQKPEFVFNAYGKSPIEFARFEADMFKWQQAEERTGNWILLEKLNKNIKR